MHLAKSPQPYSMSTPACSFVLSEITGTAGNRDEKKKISQTRQPFYPAGFGALHYFISQLICIKHIHRVPLPVCLSHFASLPLCTSHFSPPLLFLPPPSILVDMLQLKVAPDECSFETNRAGGRIQEGFFYMYVDFL